VNGERRTANGERWSVCDGSFKNTGRSFFTIHNRTSQLHTSYACCVAASASAVFRTIALKARTLSKNTYTANKEARVIAKTGVSFADSETAA